MAHMTIEQIKLKDLVRAGQKRLTLDETYTYEDLPLAKPVEVHAELELNDLGLTLRGVYSGVFEEPCDRCLEPFQRDVYQRFSERFVYASFIDDYPGGDMELSEDDFYDTIGPEGILDVKDLIHQYLVIALSSDRVCEKPTCEILPAN